MSKKRLVRAVSTYKYLQKSYGICVMSNFYALCAVVYATASTAANQLTVNIKGATF